MFRLSDDAHDQERFRRRKLVRVLGHNEVMPTAEDVIIMKLRWARVKDRADIRDVLSVQGDKLDWDYIHNWCDQHGTREKLEEIQRTVPKV